MRHELLNYWNRYVIHNLSISFHVIGASFAIKKASEFPNLGGLLLYATRISLHRLRGISLLRDRGKDLRLADL